MVYLGGNEYGTFEYLSKILGKQTERTKSQSISRGSHGSSSESVQTAGRELSMPDEIRRLNDNDCLLLLRSEDPVIDQKYDILKHPNVRFTPDGGGEPFVMPGDHMAQATTITMDMVDQLTQREISPEMYQELHQLQKTYYRKESGHEHHQKPYRKKL